MKYKYNNEWKEMNVKVSDTLPIGSIVEYDGDTVPIGYEGVNRYSTNEVKTGDTWIDSKPIYRKVIQDNVIGTTVNHGILNIDEITDIKLIVLQQSGLYSPQNSDSIFIDDTNYTVYLQTTNVLNYKIIVEYTKTTN